MINTLLGLLLILLGLLVKKYPNLIAGYNTMSAEQKANVDVDGLSSHMRNSMIVIGSLLVTINILNRFLDVGVNPAILTIAIVMPGTLYMVVKSQSFLTKAQQKQGSSSLIVAVSVVVITSILVVALVLYGSKSTEFLVQNNQLIIKGMYSLTTEIRQVEQLESLPTILKRTNGYSSGGIKKGNFRLEEFGQCKLFLESTSGPFIYFETSDSIPVIINTESKEKTVALLSELRQISR